MELHVWKTPKTLLTELWQMEQGHERIWNRLAGASRGFPAGAPCGGGGSRSKWRSQSWRKDIGSNLGIDTGSLFFKKNHCSQNNYKRLNLGSVRWRAASLGENKIHSTPIEYEPQRVTRAFPALTGYLRNLQRDIPKNKKTHPARSLKRIFHPLQDKHCCRHHSYDTAEGCLKRHLQNYLKFI